MNKLLEYLFHNPLYFLPFILLPVCIIFLGVASVKKKFMKKSKQEVKDVEEISKEKKTANSLVDVADIDGCFLYRGKPRP